jgi:hypothetical protein
MDFNKLQFNLFIRLYSNKKYLLSKIINILLLYLNYKLIIKSIKIFKIEIKLKVSFI